MQIYLPIAEVSVNAFLLLGLGGIVGILSGMFGVGGGVRRSRHELHLSLLREPEVRGTALALEGAFERLNAASADRGRTLKGAAR